MKTKAPCKEKISVITLGCSKNLVDSENLITQLRANDYEVLPEHADADTDIVIINTCGFIELAKQESIDAILEYAALKRAGKIDKLYVTGCLSQRYRNELEAEIPEVDAFFGTLEMPALLARLNADYKHELLGEREITTLPHYAYLKISEGCNRTCSFCAIPLMRGRHISRPVEELVQEAKSLARRGVKELILIAQELTYYGLDLYKKRELPRLLHALADVEGIEWIRLHYAYPSRFPLEVLDVMAERPNVCKYLDIPLQHASDRILEAMRRQITCDETRRLLDRIRQRIPGITLRTTFLVGFPGETEADFELLLDFVEEQRFDRVGVFQYSHEENTRAYEFLDDVPPEVKAERAERLMEVQREISQEKNEAKVGRTFKVLFDRKERAYFVGRTEADSPEVDNEVRVEARSNHARIGNFSWVRITQAEAYDLYGIVEPHA
ncbi:MAG: 30S ribosomal protein S12 methylthiotransferase RimO [Saprospiraceae bacterium]|nr:30S ribosomal protein S12 methylthiotransferase RimO [Saprospiraceae bacterium]MDW8483452.1 30S ribosomal protein S12 methylthiotransferase RimO [Saprospiraceae bacterium]